MKDEEIKNLCDMACKMSVAIQCHPLDYILGLTDLFSKDRIKNVDIFERCKCELQKVQHNYTWTITKFDCLASHYEFSTDESLPSFKRLMH
jgi:hypothetical protein